MHPAALASLTPRGVAPCRHSWRPSSWSTRGPWAPRPPSLRPLQGRGSQHFWPPLRGVHRSPSNTTPVLPCDAHARGPGKPWHGPPLSLTHQATPSRHWDLSPSEKMSPRLLSPPSWRLPWRLSSPTLQSRGHCSSESPAPPPRLAPLVPQPPTSDQESLTALKQKPRGPPTGWGTQPRPSEAGGPGSSFTGFRSKGRGRRGRQGLTGANQPAPYSKLGGHGHMQDRGGRSPRRFRGPSHRPGTFRGQESRPDCA